MKALGATLVLVVLAAIILSVNEKGRETSLSVHATSFTPGPLPSPTTLYDYKATIAAIDIAAAAAAAEGQYARATRTAAEIAFAQEEQRAQATWVAEDHQVRAEATRIKLDAMAAADAMATTRTFLVTATAQANARDEQAHEIELREIEQRKELRWANVSGELKGLAKAAPWLLLFVTSLSLALGFAYLTLRVARAQGVEHKLAVVAAAATGHTQSMSRDISGVVRRIEDPEIDDILEMLEAALRLGSLAQTQLVSYQGWPHGGSTWTKIVNRLLADDQVILYNNAYHPKRAGGIEAIYDYYTNLPPTPVDPLP